LASGLKKLKMKKTARKLASEAGQQMQKVRTNVVKSASDSDVLQAIEQERLTQQLKLVLKADVQGSLESMITSLEELGNDEISVKVIASGVGDISESDITAAQAAEASIVGFNVHASGTVKRQAVRENIDIKNYTVIYQLLDDVKEKMQELLQPNIVEEELGTLKVKGIFRTTQKQVVCGGLVTEGKLVNNQSIVKIFREDEQIAEATIVSLQKGQDVVKEVFKDDMCGLELATDEKVNLKEGDKLVCIQRTSVVKKL